MNGWHKVALGTVFETVTGSTPPKNNADFYGQYIPLVKPPELLDGIIDSAEDGLSEAGAKVARTVPPNSILVSCIGNLAKIGLSTVPVAFNQQINAILPNVKKAIPKFVFYQVLSKEFKDQMERLASGTTVAIVNKSKFNTIEVVLPPLSEQKRIVSIIDETFKGIDTALANTAKNLANARDLFENHLNSVLARRGRGWEEKTLQQVSLIFGRGKSRHRPRNDPKLYGGSYPFIQTGDVRNCDHVVLESTQTYNEVGLAQSKLWPKGTICITIAANIAETGILGFDACFPDSIIGIVVDERETTSDFVEYLLQSVKIQLKSQGKGSAQDNINLATFENRKFLFPPLKKQRAFVGILNELSERVRQLEFNYEQKLLRLNELRQSILWKAFNGDLTAPSVEAVQEAAE